MSAKRVLVTTAASFVGRHLVATLAASRSSHRVIAFDGPGCTDAESLSSLARENRDLVLWEGSAQDKSTVENLVRQSDVVINLADDILPGRAAAGEPVDGFQRAVAATQVLLEAARRYPPERILHLSSARAYGSAEMVPMTEEHRLAPLSPSGAAIASADRLAYSYSVAHDLPVVILRRFNVYGPGQPLGKLVPRLTVRALKSEPLSIYGDGAATRDWIHIDDLCRAIISAITADLGRMKGEAINIGTGRETSFLKLGKVILDASERPESLLRFARARATDERKQVASTSKASFLLGWEAGVDFEAGVERTVEWYAGRADWWQGRLGELEEE